MADHAVRRIGGLVEEQARETEKRIPEGRRDHAVGEILGTGFNGSAADAMHIEAVGVATDNLGHRSTSGLQARVERVRDGADVQTEAALRQEDGHHHCLGEPAPGQGQKGPRHCPAEARRAAEENCRSGGSPGAACAWRRRIVVHPTIESLDSPAEQNDWMRQPPPEPGRIPDQCVDHQGEQQSPAMRR